MYARFPVLRLWLFLALCLMLLPLASTPAPLHAQGEPQMEEMEPPTEGAEEVDGEPDRLNTPPLPENPTQLDHGAYEFSLRCMACHGDRGQGLTDEWRAAWGKDEENCWQSKCHAANFPRGGFKLPTFAPRVIGEGALARFESAADLHTFIAEKMPWHQPGSLDDTMYWQLTAYLLHSNNVPLGEPPLGPDNAADIRLRPAPIPPPTEPPSGVPVAAALSGTLLLTALAVDARRRVTGKNE